MNKIEEITRKVIRRIGLKSRIISDELYVRNDFLLKTGIPLDLTHPLTFNSKLQYLKLHDRNPAYTEMVDKAAAKDYVVRTLKAAGVQAPEQYIIPTLAQYRTWDEIDFAALPSQFVLKCTHDSGGLVIVKNKAEFLADPARVRAAKRKLAKSLKRNFYYSGREWPYKNVPPRIIAEKYMEDKGSASMRDYKFFCFNGKPETMYLSEGLEDHATAAMSFYNMDFKLDDYKRKDYRPIPYTPVKPKTFAKMKEFASILSKGLAHLRVDFYEINGKLYFGELTFYTCSGFIPWADPKYDRALGDLIDLSLAYDNQKK